MTWRLSLLRAIRRVTQAVDRAATWLLADPPVIDPEALRIQTVSDKLQMLLTRRDEHDAEQAAKWAHLREVLLRQQAESTDRDRRLAEQAVAARARMAAELAAAEPDLFAGWAEQHGHRSRRSLRRWRSRAS